MRALRREREQRGWSQEEVARRTGIDQASISRIERGWPVYPGWQRRLSRLFKMPVETLFAEVSDDGNQPAATA